MLVSICPPEVARGASPAPPKAVKVVFNACRIPDHDDVIYCTLTVANVGLAKAAARPRHAPPADCCAAMPSRRQRWRPRSEEHTSELQSLMRISYDVFCLKKQTQ